MLRARNTDILNAAHGDIIIDLMWSVHMTVTIVLHSYILLLQHTRLIGMYQKMCKSSGISGDRTYIENRIMKIFCKNKQKVPDVLGSSTGGVVINGEC